MTYKEILKIKDGELSITEVARKYDTHQGAVQKRIAQHDKNMALLER